MNNIKKRLEELKKNLSNAWWNYWNYQGTPLRDDIEKWWLNKISTSITQAIVEERERVRGVIRNMPAITRSEAENENCVNMDDLLESLDKPLT